MNSSDTIPLFFGINNCNLEQANLIAVGIPWDHSSSYRKGSSKAPDLIRQATTSALYNQFSETQIDLISKWQLFDYGNIENSNDDPLACQQAVLTSLKEIYSKNTTSSFLFFGGDHLITCFSFISLFKSGFYNNKNVGIIYLDAHPDLYNDYEGDKYSHACVLRRIIDETNIRTSNILQVGLRALTPKQIEYANQNRIKMISRKEFQTHGPEGTAQIAKEMFNKKVDSIYLSIDLDIFDPSFAPGIGNPEPGGLITTEIVDFLHGLSGLPLHAFDIVEYNPKFDNSQITAFLAAKLCRETLSIMK